MANGHLDPAGVTRSHHSFDVANCGQRSERLFAAISATHQGSVGHCRLHPILAHCGPPLTRSLSFPAAPPTAR
jgi:hypothetical protein